MRASFVAHVPVYMYIQCVLPGLEVMCELLYVTASILLYTYRMMCSWARSSGEKCVVPNVALSCEKWSEPKPFPRTTVGNQKWSGDRFWQPKVARGTGFGNQKWSGGIGSGNQK